MDLLEATIKSIKAYYEDNAFGETGKLKEVKYSKKYFDDFEKETFGEKEAKAEPKESKVDPKKQATLSKMMSESETNPKESNKIGGIGEGLK